MLAPRQCSRNIFQYRPFTAALGLWLLITAALAVPAAAQEIVDSWRLQLQKPADGWSETNFDDGDWQEAQGGFGTLDTPGARIGTTWATKGIWIRKHFPLASVPDKPALLIHHDEDAEVFLNGKRIAQLKGFVSDYQVLPLDESGKSALQVGDNVLAIHCRQSSGGQFIDAHVVDADQVPKLPAPKRNTKPFASELITPWGAEVTAENVWDEYPRPQLRRDSWTNLNGLWDYAITPVEQKETPTQWMGQILVPFCLESKLGGVHRLLDASEALWYHRTFDHSANTGERLLLNFEAVDYACDVSVNGKVVGSHRGGNTPFSIDITDAARKGSNSLVVRVQDETEGWQLRGKQTLNARGIWYTQVSGIWQTVWLEKVPQDYLQDIKIHTDAATGTISVRPVVVGSDGLTVSLVVKDGANVVAQASASDSSRDKPIHVVIPNVKPWSPDSPFLYALEVTLKNNDGQIVDRIESYAGVRTVGKRKDANGHWRFTLNGEEIFHWGPLDQGWWPDGLLTPPSDEAMAFDIQWLKDAGFNMIRKHIKVEPRRYYYHCDSIGMMLWQDHVSGGKQPDWTRLQPNPKDATWPESEHAQFMLELERMISLLENHPSIVCWVPFNEAWGQHRTMDVGKWTVQRDPSRTVNIASGGNFWPVGDVVDAHAYPDPSFPYDQGQGGRFDDYIQVMGEFGGHGLPVQGHLWDANRRNWGYGGLPQNEQEYKDRYVTSLRKLNELRLQGIAAGVYTQTTDVEGEINGLMTYDRKVIKIDAAELAKLHEVLFQPDSESASKPTSDVPDASADQTNTSSIKPKPVMDRATIRAGLASHDRALHIKAGWIRDPYIVLAPDGYYYLTGTQPNPGDPRESQDPYNTGLGDDSIVGEKVRVWRSPDLIDWESLGEPFDIEDTVQYRANQKNAAKRLIWAPELHWLGDRWALVHCPRFVSSLAVSSGPDVKGPWTHPLQPDSGEKHDPSLFQDSDGTWYLLWQNTQIAPLSKDLSSFSGEPVRIDPAGSRIGPDGKPISRIGHEGATMRKIGDKYVHLGTAWSTDVGRHGSYNLYYCTADEITGPYGPRKFAGRFLGHGTPFQDKDGKWWCTAFFNANVPPLDRANIQGRDLRQTAQTINEQGVTIVPLDVRVQDDGDVFIGAKDPAYAVPGPDEVQNFKEQ